MDAFNQVTIRNWLQPCIRVKIPDVRLLRYTGTRQAALLVSVNSVLCTSLPPTTDPLAGHVELMLCLSTGSFPPSSVTKPCEATVGASRFTTTAGGRLHRKQCDLQPTRKRASGLGSAAPMRRLMAAKLTHNASSYHDNATHIGTRKSTTRLLDDDDTQTRTDVSLAL
jgi:hypothetical protein